MTGLLRAWRPAERYSAFTPFHLLIANSGIATSTRDSVAEVRLGGETAQVTTTSSSTATGAIAQAARAVADQDTLQALGMLFNEKTTNCLPGWGSRTSSWTDSRMQRAARAPGPN